MTQIRSCGTMPSTIVQAEEQVPSMTTLFAGVSNFHEARPIDANIAALVVDDADDRRRSPRQRRKKDRGEP